MPRLFRPLAAAFVLASASVAPAQTWNQTAAGTYGWATTTNWNPTTVPNSATAIANVNNNIAGAVTITLDAPVAGNPITVDDLNLGDSTSTFFPFTIAPGNATALQFNGASSVLTSRNAANVISAPVSILANTNVSHSGAGGLTMSGPVTIGAGATMNVLATGSSSGDPAIGITITGQITGAGGLTKGPSGGNFMVLTNPTNNYSGPTAISSGAIRLFNGGVISPNSNLNIGGTGATQLFPDGSFNRPLGAGPGEIQFTSTGAVGFGAIGAPAAVTFGTPAAVGVWGSAAPGFVRDGQTLQLSSSSSTDTLTLVNPIDLNGGARTIDIGNGSALIDAVLSGTISSSVSPSVAALTKTGIGTLRVDASTTFTGVFRVQQGVVAFGTLGNPVSVAGNLAVTAGAAFSPSPGTTYTASLGTGAGQLDLAPATNSTGGGFAAVGGPVTVNLGGAGAQVVWNQGNFVPDNQNFILQAGSGGGTLTFLNPIDLNLLTPTGGAANTRTFQVGDGTADVDTQIPVVISNSGSVGTGPVLTKTQPGVLELTANNTFSGGVAVLNGLIRVGSDGATPGSPAPLGIVPAAPAIDITLNGGGLQYGGVFALHPNRQINLSTALGNGTIDTNGFNVSLPNRVTGPGNLIKSGSGTLTLNGTAGTYDYTGGTQVANGTLLLAGGDNTLPTTNGIVLGPGLTGTTVGNLDLGTTNQTLIGLVALSDNAAAANTVTVGPGRTLSIVNPNAPANAGLINETPAVLLGNSGNGTAVSRTNVTFTGGGAMVVNAPLSIFHVGQAAGGIPTFGNLGAVDFSGLASLNATVTEVRVGDFGNTSNPGAMLVTLAPSTTITASRSISVGTSGRFSQSGPAGARVNTVLLGGGANVFNTPNLYLGSNLNPADPGSSISLITAPRSQGAILFAGPTGTLTLRANVDGTGRSNIFLGSLSAGTAAGRTNTFDVTGHAADLLLDQLVVGAPNTYSATGGTLDNTFSFDTGALDVNTVAIARQGTTTTATVGLANMTGTVNLGGGTVTVNTGPVTVATAAAAATGVGTTVTNTGRLNVSGGAVSILGGGVTLGNSVTGNQASLVAELNVSGGTLAVGGPIGPGAETTRVTSSLSLTGGTLNMNNNDIGNVTNLTFSGGTLRNPATIARGVDQTGGTLVRDTAGTTRINGAYNLTTPAVANVTAGSLLVNGSTGSAAGTGTVNVSGSGTFGTGGFVPGNGGTLGGTGALNAGNVNIGTTAPGSQGGTLSPGASIGTLTLGNGTMTWNPGGSYVLEYNTQATSPANPGVDNDYVASAGTLNLANLTPASFNLNLVPTNSPVGPTSPVQYTLGTFAGGVNGASGDITSLFNFSGMYAGSPAVTVSGTNVLVTFTPVPEPAAVFAACGFAGALAWWKRRRSS